MPEWFNREQLLPSLMTSVKPAKCKEKESSQVQGNEVDAKDEVAMKKFMHLPLSAP